MTLTWVDATFVFAKEVPSQDEVIHKIADNSAVHPEVPFVDAKGDVNDAEGLNFAAVYAVSSAEMRGDFAIV